MPSFRITDQPIDPGTLARALNDPRAGALASFEGRVRDHDQGEAVDALEYEAFGALAASEGGKLLAEAMARFDLVDVHAVHRVGRLELGEVAVWVGALAAHREAAFRACRHVIDTLKLRLPIWKKEHFRDGAALWVNAQTRGGAALAEADLYARQLQLAEIGSAGQAKLKAAKVLVVGCGGLAAGAAPLLAAAGVGTIGLVDFDRLEASNLNRQTLFEAAGIGRPKVALAAERLRAQNPFVTVVEHPVRLSEETAPALIAGYDLVLDCADTYAAKYLVSDCVALQGKIAVQASVHRFEGQLHAYRPDGAGGCVRCLWPEPPAQGAVGACAEIGVLGAVPSLLGVMQAAEAIKQIVGLGGRLDAHLLLVDALGFATRRLARPRRADCPACGTRTLARPGLGTETPAWELAAEAVPADAFWIDIRELAEGPSQPGVRRVPLSGLDVTALDWPRDRPVAVHCASGARSGALVARLRAMGWSNVLSVPAPKSPHPNPPPPAAREGAGSKPSPGSAGEGWVGASGPPESEAA